MPKPREAWEDHFGFAPHKVWVYERAEKGGTLYLRWWDQAAGNWRKRSLGCLLRDERGRVLPHVQAMARQAARDQYEKITGKRAPEVVASATPLTLGGTWALLTDRGHGLYPHDTPHRREVARALTFAARILGADTPWAAIERTKLRQVVRARVDELVARGKKGVRPAEIVMQRLTAVSAWLRDEGHIPVDAGIPARTWRDDLASYAAHAHGGRLPDVARPRHTLDEMRRLLEAAWTVDPRFGLLMALGAELRLGQVVRCRRSDLDLDHRALTVAGRGKKRGTVVLLTDGQMRAVRRALDGYLARLERQAADYPLFPAGQMEGGRLGHPVADPRRHQEAQPVNRRTLTEWLHLAEETAEIPHVAGRGAYGLRRAAVDAVKEMGISREGLQQHGGWSDTQVPDQIYADQTADYARREAMQKRAQLRGESDDVTR